MRMKPNPIFEDIKAKIYKREENAIILFLGKVRKGKSFCSISLGEYIDSRFNVEKNVVYEIDEFYRIINDPNTNQITIIIEELGVKFDKRRFMSLQNMIISHTLQTFAHKRLCLIMNCPSMSYIDARFESMIDYVFTVKHAYKQGGLLRKTLFKVRKPQHNPDTGKTYSAKRPVFYIKGKKTYISGIVIPVPAEDTIAKYKVKSFAYKERLNKELGERIEEQQEQEDAKREKSKQPSKTDDDIIEEVMRNQSKYVGKYKGKPHIAQPVLMEFFKVGGGRAYRINKILNTRLEQAHTTLSH